MKPFRMLYLPESNKAIGLLLLLLCACSGSRLPDTSSLPGPYSALASGGLIYDAAFQYKDFNASGLLVMKKLGPEQYHVVLLSKFGPSLLEFKMDAEGIYWIKTFEQLNKKGIQKLLERDFRMLLLSGLEHPEKVKLRKAEDSLLVYQVKADPRMRLKLDPQKRRVLYAENRGFINPVKTKAHFAYGEDSIPQKISLSHRNVQMRLDLKLLKVNHAER